MDGFFLTPNTRFHDEMLQGQSDAGALGASKTGQTGKDVINGFAEIVQDKMGGNRDDNRRTDSSKKMREKSLLEKKAKRHKLYLDLAQKAWYRHENELKFQEQIAIARKEVSSAILKQQSIERATGETIELDANPAVLSKAASDLAQAYVFFKIPSARVNARPKVGK